MHLLPIDVSPRQVGKLRKGHPVRVKKGSGLNLLVNPSNYRLATRAFAKNKGLELKLTPEEIEANRSLTPEQHSQLRKEASTLDMFKELPFAGRGLFAGGDIKEKLMEKGIDVAFNLLSKKLGLGVGNGLYAGRGIEEDLNKALGTNMGYLKKAGVASKLSNQLNSKLTDSGFSLKHEMEPIKEYYHDALAPRSRGSGIKPHRMTSSVHPGRRTTGMLIGRGTLHNSDSHLPPALHSQPYGANFHFQFQLPPQYKRYNSGGEDLGGN